MRCFTFDAQPLQTHGPQTQDFAHSDGGLVLQVGQRFDTASAYFAAYSPRPTRLNFPLLIRARLTWVRKLLELVR
jgi:hypothetical protein